MTWYPTQSHYPDTRPASPCPILIMPSTWLGSDKYQFDKLLVWLDHGFEPTISCMIQVFMACLSRTKNVRLGKQLLVSYIRLNAANCGLPWQDGQFWCSIEWALILNGVRNCGHPKSKSFRGIRALKLGKRRQPGPVYCITTRNLSKKLLTKSNKWPS